MAQWLETPPGRYIVDWEQAQFDAHVSDIFGFHAAQLGLPHIETLRANRIPFKWLAVDAPTAPALRSCQLMTQFEELPFASQSLDLLVLPHTLELAAEPHQLLREAERVLLPEGKLVVTCFNPYSLWGARQFAGRLTGVPFLPRAGQFISLPRLRDWLKLLSFELEGGKFGCYRPAVRAQPWLDRTALMEKAGDRWWPVLGAVYLLTAVKRVRGMRLIGPARKARVAASASVAPAVNRAERQ
jgi:SAM-dependent methyltransferase